MKSFIKFSQNIGKNPAYVQGRGGNTSYKKNDVIFIKASGFRLKDVNLTDGIVRCHISQLYAFFHNGTKKRKNDSTLNEVVDSAIINASQNIKPSMEIGMHVVIPSRYIIHTHSAYVNVFACMKNPEKYLDRLPTKYPYEIIPYKNPGFELAAYLYSVQKKRTLPPVLILKNHGIVVHSNSLAKIKKIHTDINTRLKKLTGEYKKNAVVAKDPLPLLIPDAVIYNHVQSKGTTSSSQNEIIEIASVLQFVQEAIEHLGEEVVCLSQKNIQSLLRMDREQLRIETIHKL